MKTDWSRMIRRRRPGGRAFVISAILRLTVSMMRMVFVADWRRTSSETAGLPKSMFQLRGSAKPSSTRPTSLTRTGVRFCLLHLRRAQPEPDAVSNRPERTARRRRGELMERRVAGPDR